jgi:hypothetical protein
LCDNSDSIIYYIIKTTNNQWPGFNTLDLQHINNGD